jgi:ATP-dependent RNA helicase DBP3
LVEDGSCSLSSINYVVLDEADRLLDLGFEKEIKKIISLTRKDRQTAMFSATWPTSVQKLAQEYLNAPVKVTVGSKDLGANNNITQIVEVVEPKDKDWKLTQLLNKYHASRRNKIVLFALYKKEAARLEKNLSSAGWNCVAIHGDMSQDQRTRSFEKFRSGEIPLLIATDVAARGLDIPSVEYVINYTFPLTTEDYVHRIGRTGRAGEKGTAHTFFTSFDKARAGELINVLKQAKQEVPESLMSFGTTVKKKEHSAYGAFFKDVDPNQKGTKITFGSDDEQ